MPATRTGVIDHMAFTGRDLKAVKARFDERGLKYDLRRQAGAGTWQLFTLDPNGAKVELDFDPSEVVVTAPAAGLRAFRLDDRVAVITGGAQGIGLACATLMAEAGASVVLLDRDAAALADGARATACRAGAHARRHRRISGRAHVRGHRGRTRAHRRARQQRRPRDSQGIAGVAAGRVGCRGGGQPDRRLLVRTRRRTPHAGQRRQHRQHGVDHGSVGRRPVPQHLVPHHQGRTRHDDACAVDRMGVARHPRQRGGTELDQDRFHRPAGSSRPN